MPDLIQQISPDRLGDVIAALKCDVELPETWHDFFEESGLLQGSVCERRKFARWHNRTAAGLLYRTTFPVLPRARQWHRVYLRDLSRVGVAFVHSEQLFLREQMHILLVDDVSRRLLGNLESRSVEIVRCDKVQENCFEIRAHFRNA